ncbi:MAG: hypothetical protein ACI9UT_001982 [Flavobacteriales bacterium]|jgi:hypothetical protein
MNRYGLLVLFTWMILLTSNVAAEEVQLVQGETYIKGNVTVTCGLPITDNPLALNDCQYWDDFSNKCLFEKTTYTNKNLECVEKCERWDKFTSTCFYQSKCSFHSSHMTFVRTSCEKFDDFNNTCLKMKDTNIGP